MSVNSKMYTRSFYADFGIQYHKTLGRKVNLTIGAVYGYRQRLDIDNTVTLTDDNSNAELSNNTVKQYLPQFFGLGAALEYKKWTYAFDYSFRQYSAFASNDTRISFNDSHELRTGVCYYPNGYMSGSYWKRIYYKAGLDIVTPYMLINNKSGLGYRASAGLGFPVLNGYIHIALFYDRLQLQQNTFNRSVRGLTVTYTLGEKFNKIKL